MFKKSFSVVLIQLFGILLSLASMYLIAGDMEPEVYSLIGIYAIVSGITLTFSDLGLETTMMREALYWQEQGDKERISEYATQAVVSRVIALLVLLPFLTTYLLIMSYTKYDGQHIGLLFLFLIGASVSSMNNAMSLMIRAQGGYVFSQLVNTINNYALKFAGIALYYIWGANAYLIFYGLSSIPLLFVYLWKQRNVLALEKINIKATLKKVYLARYLWLKTDLDYIKGNADSILVSAIFPASIMGSYTIYKQLEQMAKSVIEGFFDVLSQNSVKFKGNTQKLTEWEKKCKMARNVVIAIIVCGLGLFSVNPPWFVDLVNLSRYQSMVPMVYCVGLVSIAYLLGKYEINALAFFAAAKLNFNLGMVSFTLSVASFLIVALMPDIHGVLAQRVFIYVLTSLIAILVFKKHRKSLYTEVLQ